MLQSTTFVSPSDTTAAALSVNDSVLQALRERDSQMSVKNNLALIEKIKEEERAKKENDRCCMLIQCCTRK